VYCSGVQPQINVLFTWWSFNHLFVITLINKYNVEYNIYM
jgi:hypothetical protein